MTNTMSYAQDLQAKPLRLVTVGTGGTADLVSRLLAQGITANTNQPVVVENRGGSLIIPVQVVAKAAPDGHTLLIISNGMWTLPLLQGVPYDAVRDFAAVTYAVKSPILLVIHPSLPAKSAKELIALARGRPGQLNYATGPTGTTNHLAGELFMSMAGLNLNRVPYGGTGAALTDLITGQVQVMFANVAPVASLVRAGRLRALAVTSSRPTTLFLELPPLAEVGLKGYEAESVVAVFAPANTPSATVNRLNTEFVRVLSGAEVKGKLLAASVEIVAAGPEHLARFVNDEIVRMSKVIKQTGN